MNLFGLQAKPKARPTKAEVIKLVLQFFADHTSEIDSATIHGDDSQYTVTIVRSVIKPKVRS